MKIWPQPSPPLKTGQVLKSGYVAQGFGGCVKKKKKKNYSQESQCKHNDAIKLISAWYSSLQYFNWIPSLKASQVTSTKSFRSS